MRFEFSKSLSQFSVLARVAKVSTLFAIFLPVTLQGTDSVSRTANDFSVYAMKLRDKALMKVKPQVVVPSAAFRANAKGKWKENIVTTVFWIGERPSRNNPTPNRASSWDGNWAANYGGYDTPDTKSRRNFIPVKFVPKQNPFYCALPYNDVTRGKTKSEARKVIPWFNKYFAQRGSVCPEGSLDCHQIQRPRGVCTVGRCGSIPHGSFSVRFRKRAPSCEPQRWSRTRRFPGDSRLSWDEFNSRSLLVALC